MEREMEFEVKEKNFKPEYEAKETNWKAEYQMLQKKHMILQQEYEKLTLKNQNNNLFLRVYVDVDEQKYFIDTFAAFSLDLISYQSACSLYDENMKLYEITDIMLKQYKEIFKDRIEYKYLPSKRDTHQETLYNDFNSKIYNEFDNKENDNNNNFFNKNIIIDDQGENINNKKI